jgi:hypothetical protein
VTIVELGALGEFVAAIAVVITLIYLALQIRQNTRATHAASFHAITDSFNHVNVSVAQTPGLARIWLAGATERSSRSDEEQWQFDLICLSYFHVFETIHYQARVGAGDSGLVVAEERSLEALLATSGVREWWRENPYAFGPEFRAHADRFLPAGRD